MDLQVQTVKTKTTESGWPTEVNLADNQEPDTERTLILKQLLRLELEGTEPVFQKRVSYIKERSRFGPQVRSCPKC